MKAALDRPRAPTRPHDRPPSGDRPGALAALRARDGPQPPHRADPAPDRGARGEPDAGGDRRGPHVDRTRRARGVRGRRDPPRRGQRGCRGRRGRPRVSAPGARGDPYRRRRTGPSRDPARTLGVARQHRRRPRPLSGARRRSRRSHRGAPDDRGRRHDRRAARQLRAPAAVRPRAVRPPHGDRIGGGAGDPTRPRVPSASGRSRGSSKTACCPTSRSPPGTVRRSRPGTRPGRSTSTSAAIGTT